MTETFEDSTDSSDPGEELGQSPLERFIFRELEPQRENLNSWKADKSHLQMLIDSARRRKLHPQKIGASNIPTFTLPRAGNQVAGIHGKITTLVSDQALRAANSRELTRQCLVLSNVPHLPGQTFHISQVKTAASFMESLGEPVSIRPASGASRTGVHANLTTVDELADAWEHAAAACSKLPAVQQQIDVEAFRPWVALRVFVVSEEPVAAVARVPLYVVGDGSTSLGQLAHQEVERRNSCGFLTPVKGSSAEDRLNAQGLSSETVPRRDQLQVLNYDQTGQQGQGWSVDVLDLLGDRLNELAVNALWAFPGLSATAVDILTPSVGGGEHAVVSGVEPEADLREFRFPAFGAARFPNRAMMDRIAGLS